MYLVKRRNTGEFFAMKIFLKEDILQRNKVHDSRDKLGKTLPMLVVTRSNGTRYIDISRSPILAECTLDFSSTNGSVLRTLMVLNYSSPQ